MALSKYVGHKRALLYPSDELNKKRGIVFFFFSLLFHALFLFGVLLFQDFSMPKPMPPVIKVDLVSFAPEPLAGEDENPPKISDKKVVSTKTTVFKKSAPKKIPNIKPDISLKTKPKNLKQLMAQKKKKKKEPVKPEKKEEPKELTQPIAEEPDPKKILEDARKDLENKIEAQEQERINQALSRLEKKVHEQGKSGQTDNTQAYAGSGRKGYKPIDLYNLVIGSEIEQNWVFNDVLARMDQKLEVRILIKILKNGEIRDIIYETRSGNRYLDESAKKAVRKANPLPPLPSGLYSYDIGLIFTPKGLK